MHVVKTGEKEMEFDILPLKMGDRGSNFGSAGNVKSEVHHCAIIEIGF